MEQQPDKKAFFSDLKKLVVDYLQNRLALVQLTAYEKIARIAGVLFSGIVLLILLFFSLLFISLAGGFYFSQLFQSTFYGFSLIAVCYVMLFVLLLVFRKRLLEQFVINAVIRILFDQEDETTQHP